MFIRCAFFLGRPRPDCEEAFAAYVRDKLVPLWTRFPGAEEVRVLRQVETDRPDVHHALVLAVRYPSRAAIETALASPVRLESREMTKGLLDLFDGTVFHTVFSADDYPVAA